MSSINRAFLGPCNSASRSVFVFAETITEAALPSSQAQPGVTENLADSPLLMESSNGHSRREKYLEFRLARIYNVETFWQGAAIMEAVIRKWGNSPALRLPVAVIKEADFNLEQKVNISVTRGRIVIEPSDTVEYDLDQLLSGITATNSHNEVSFGSPVGKEAF